MIRALYVPLALGSLLAFAARFPVGLCCPPGDPNCCSRSDPNSDCNIEEDKREIALIEAEPPMQTVQAADDNAAIEATAIGDGIASGVTAAVSSASFATGASAVFGAAMVLMA